MVIGVAVWELEIFGCQSLKEKRRVVRSLKDRLRDRFNVSVAETAHHDLWQRAELTACCVSRERRPVESILEKADRLVAREHRARIIDSYRSFR
ncbi:MAG: DUF503 domain-containing protein [Longimicrobiales bacterium]